MYCYPKNDIQSCMETKHVSFSNSFILSGSAESVPSTDSSSQDELMKSLNYEQESYV